MGIKINTGKQYSLWVLFVLISVIAVSGLALFTLPRDVNAAGCPSPQLQGDGTASMPNVNKCYQIGGSDGTITEVGDVPGAAPTPNNSGVPGSNGAQPGSGTQTTPPEDGTTCAIEKVGWILCPVIEGVATMSDKIFDLLAGNFLQIEPELTKADSGIKIPWEAARNIANILFIVAFIIIIYSQITGAGISNYGVKKMLPRLIMAALLVNISFWICQGMVDLSNILGYNIYEFLKASAASIGPSAMTDIPGPDTVTGGGWLSVLAVAILAAAGIAWLLLAPLGTIALMVLITCVTIVVILLLRKAIIILLVVISPIAFVAYLLPNTEKFFNKWLSMFWQLLMVFPVVALLMGGGQLASTIIMSAGASDDPKTQCSAEDAGKVTSIGAQSDGYNVSCEGSIPVGPDGDRHVGWMLGLTAAGIAVAPLLAVWAVLKGALAAAGAIGGKISGAVQKGTDRGARNAAKNLGDRYKNSTMGKRQAFNKKVREGNIRAGTHKGSVFRPDRKLRNTANKIFNNESIMPAGYSAQRGKDNRKIGSERAREKAEEFAGNMSYADEFTKASKQYDDASNAHDRDEAMINMSAAMLAASRTDDSTALAGMRPIMADARKQQNDTGRSSASNTNLHAQSQAAATQQPTATSPNGNTAPTPPQPMRLSFSAPPAAGGGGMSKRSGRDVLSQVHSAGGIGNVTNEDLVGAFKHASDHLSAGGLDVGHEELGTQVVEELAKRGLNTDGVSTGRNSSDTSDPTPPASP